MATFEHRQGLALDRSTDRYLEALEKYRERGWTISENHRNRETDFWMGENRWLTDGKVWRLPLDIEGVDAMSPSNSNPKSEAMTLDPVLLNSFMLGQATRRPRADDHYNGPGIIAHTRVITHPTLRYQYLTVDEDFQERVQMDLDKPWSKEKVDLTQLPLTERETKWTWYISQ